jgi:hypothetical protein
MKKLNPKIWLLVISLVWLWTISSQAQLTEEQAAVNLPSQIQSSATEDIAGELLIELKEGNSLDDISGLNQKYGISTGEQAFKTFLETQKQKEKEEPKRPSGPTTKKHEGWYWQLDKESQESKEYQERVAKETEKSQSEQSIQIIQEEQKITQGEIGPYKLGNIYVLKVPKGADTVQMVQDYKAHPAVKNAAFQGK